MPLGTFQSALSIMKALSCSKSCSVCFSFCLVTAKSEDIVCLKAFFVGGALRAFNDKN